MRIVLTNNEKVELSYLRLKGFRYLVRNEIGSVEVFVNKPHRDKEVNYIPFGKARGGYDTWIETKTPISIEEQKRCRDVELDRYEFITWKDEPMLIDDLISEVEELEEDVDYEYELIECSVCNEEKKVEIDTFALDEGMCEKCYCQYQGG